MRRLNLNIDMQAILQESKQWGVSILIHVVILGPLALYWFDARRPTKVATVISDLEQIEEADVPEELTPDEEIDLDAEVSLSPSNSGSIGESVASLANPMATQIQQTAVTRVISDRSLSRPLQGMAGGMGLGDNIQGLKGNMEFAAGGGDDGAIDRIVQEIMRQIAKNKVVVAWIMDSSNSLKERREGIALRFDRIYKEFDELGVNDNGALLSTIVAVGSTTTFMVEDPTNESEIITKAIRDIKPDETGQENIFTAIRQTALKYRRMQTSGRRTLVIVLLTDEIGDDLQMADETVALLKRNRVPLYALGPMASFSRPIIHDVQVHKDEEGKEWRFWIPIKRGPFTRVEEQLRVPFNGAVYQAGFGPFFLTKITRETGGLFFIYGDDRIPGAKYLPEILLQYKANYGSKQDYQNEIQKTTFRKTLMAMVEEGNRFWHHNFPHHWIYAEQWQNNLDQRQKDIAKFQEFAKRAIPVLRQLESEYPREPNLRWRANYCLTVGRVLQAKVRSDEFQWACADFAKNPRRLQDPKKNNGWVARADTTIRIGYKPGEPLEKQAKEDAAKRQQAEKDLEMAHHYFDKVSSEHAGTPWAVAARREKSNAVGYHWEEAYDDNHAATPEERRRRAEAAKKIEKL